MHIGAEIMPLVRRQTVSGQIALTLGALLMVALYARTGVWGLICKRLDAPWFPIRRILLEDRQ